MPCVSGLFLLQVFRKEKRNMAGKGNGKGNPMKALKACVRAGLKENPKAGIPTLAKSCAKQMGIKIKMKKK